MTFLEKAKSDLKDEEFSDDGLPCKCPSNYGYEKEYSCSDVECTDCWNREMPNTEPKEDAYREDMNTAYNKGLNDAWELVRKFTLKFSCKENDEIFGRTYLEEFLNYLTPQEALAKLKAYEEAQKIEVGDVVFCSLVAEDDNDTENKDNYGVVTGIYRDHYEILMKNGDTTGFKKENCKKTGKHLDLASILEQIGE